jgi:hypothetical protein
MQTRLAFIGIASLCLFVGCGSGDDDTSPGSGGSGGTSSTTGGTGGTSGSAGMASGGSAGQGASVDCSAVCGHVKTLCADRTDVDANWLSVCEEACNVRVQAAPDTAALERDCVNAAADCNAAVSCVASPH